MITYAASNFKFSASFSSVMSSILLLSTEGKIIKNLHEVFCLTNYYLFGCVILLTVSSFFTTIFVSRLFAWCWSRIRSNFDVNRTFMAVRATQKKRTINSLNKEIPVNLLEVKFELKSTVALSMPNIKNMLHSDVVFPCTTSDSSTILLD